MRVKVSITEGMNSVLRSSGHTEIKAWNVNFYIDGKSYGLCVNYDEFEKEQEVMLSLDEARELWEGLFKNDDTILV